MSTSNLGTKQNSTKKRLLKKQKKKILLSTVRSDGVNQAQNSRLGGSEPPSQKRRNLQTPPTLEAGSRVPAVDEPRNTTEAR